MIAIFLLFFALLFIMRDTFRFGISPMPTSKRVREALFEHIPPLQDGPIYDLGCGWGSLVIPLARKYPDRKIIGYEGALVPYLVAKLRTLHIPNAKIVKADFLDEDLEGALLITYLYRKGMYDLAHELHGREIHFTLISHTFHMPLFEATGTYRANDLHRTPIYLYEY